MKNKTAILLVNLGSPDSPSVVDVRRYLREFLNDRRVIDVPRWMWWPLLHGIILRTRPAQSAKAYRHVWTAQGSPLIVTTYRQAALLRQRFAADDIDVYVGMRYGNPSIGKALDDILAADVSNLIVLPLYPQYSRPTTESVRDKLTWELQKRNHNLPIDFVDSYYDHDAYIDALVDSIRTYHAQYGRPEKLVFSYHGIPQRYADNGDIYPQHCQATTDSVVAALGLAPDDYVMTYQSRFGREAWLQPYTDATLKRLAVEGVRSVHVISPAFSADCLETLEELEVENRGYFETADNTDPDNQGGRIYRYIPALNDNVRHISALESIIRQRLSHVDGDTRSP